MKLEYAVAFFITFSVLGVLGAFGLIFYWFRAKNIGSHVVTTKKTKRKLPATVKRNRALVFEYIQDGGASTVEEVSKHTGLSRSTVFKYLTYLRKKKKITRAKIGRSYFFMLPSDEK